MDDHEAEGLVHSRLVEVPDRFHDCFDLLELSSFDNVADRAFSPGLVCRSVLDSAPS